MPSKFKEFLREELQQHQQRTESELKRIVEESLSPSYYKGEEDLDKEEKNVDELVNASLQAGNHLLSKSFYAGAVDGTNLKAWKKSIKTHLSNMMLSIACIKKLPPVPADAIT